MASEFGTYTASGLQNPFGHTTYFLKKQMLKLFGGTFRIYDPSGSLALFASMKAFSLRENIRLYTEEEKIHEVLTIQARQIIDIAATYDVIDPNTGLTIGALRRRGFRSMVRDEWTILDAVGNEIGTIIEDSMLLALLRRFLTNLIPQAYHGDVKGSPVLKFQQNFNPFTLRLSLDFSTDVSGLLDRRLGIAAAILMCAIEGRESS